MTCCGASIGNRGAPLMIYWRRFGLPGKASEHEADHRKMDVGDGETCPVFLVLGEAAAATEPCEGTFDDPSLGQNLETDRMIGALDDF